jgi:hypothetical protein
MRTKLLLCGASLAPAAIVVFRMVEQEVIRDAQAKGALQVWGVEPGLGIVALLWLGMICIVGFIVSLIYDLRHPI